MKNQHGVDSSVLSMSSLVLNLIVIIIEALGVPWHKVGLISILMTGMIVAYRILRQRMHLAASWRYGNLKVSCLYHLVYLTIVRDIFVLVKMTLLNVIKIV